MLNDLQWARALVERFAGQKILVVGDLMLDRYLCGAVNRLSPEAPVPVVLASEEKNMPGGAANVARNLRALGARVAVHGVVGRDAPGDDLLRVLQKDRIGIRGVLRQAGARTTVKTRILAERQQIVRVDWEEQLQLRARVRKRFCAALAKALRGVSGIIIADYGKGAVTQQVVDTIVRAAGKSSLPVALDPKENGNLKLSGLTVVTPNRREAFALARVPEQPPQANPLKDRPLLQVAGILQRKWKPQCLLITLGAQGMLVVERKRAPWHVPTVAREVFDVSGAGDTVIAAMLVGLCAGADYRSAAKLANCAAGVVIGKLGTATCTAAELLDYLARLRQLPGATKSGQQAD